MLKKKRKKARKERWAQYQNRLNKVEIDHEVAGVIFTRVIEKAAEEGQYGKPLTTLAIELVNGSSWPPPDGFAPTDFASINLVWGDRSNKARQGALNAAWSNALQLIRKDKVPRGRRVTNARG